MTSEENADILRPLSKDEVRALLKLYKSKCGKQNFHYLLLYNQCKWDDKLEELKINAADEKWNGFRKTFYTPRKGDFREFGTYISLHFDTLQSVSINSWEPGFSQLFECLEKTTLIDWQNGPLFTNCNLEYCEKVKEIAARKGVGVQRARLCHGYIMPHEKAANLQFASLPEEYEMHSLRVEDADFVYDLWTNKGEGSLDYIRGLMEVNKSLGIYRKSDNALVAWVVQNDFSGLGFVQSLDIVQRKGFGSILAAALCRKISESEEVALSAWIVVENFKSEGLLEKVGFVKSVLNEWIQLKRPQIN